MNEMKEIQKLKETILHEYPRLSENSEFRFRCHKGVACFNECCRDVNIFLTPYDIIRLKNALGIDSEAFLKKYTLTPFDKNLKYPVILLMMQENEGKACPFVTEQGCRVYEDRPWACRMYPLGLASPGENTKELNKEFYFLLQEAVCKGFQEDKTWNVKGWTEDQGIVEYNLMGEGFKEITLHKFFQEPGNLSPQKLEMFFLVCYNIDQFRRFLFESSFFDKFEVDGETRERMRKDDVELLKFGYRWLRFSLFGEQTMNVREAVFEKKKKELEEKQARSASKEGQ